MSLRKFGPKDVNINTMRTNPQVDFFIYNGRCFYNNRPYLSASYVEGGDILMCSPPRSSRAGAAVDPIAAADIYYTGSALSMYEYNVDRTRDKWAPSTGDYSYPLGHPTNPATAGGATGTGPDYTGKPAPPAVLDPSRAPLYGIGEYIIFPYLSKDSARTSIKRTMGGDMTNDTDWATEFEFGDILTGSYPLSASISREWWDGNQSGSIYRSYWGLTNTLSHYAALSPHYSVFGDIAEKSTQPAGLIHIPSIFYGTKIKPGTVSLKYFYTGSLCAELKDTKENGELIQVSGTSDGAAYDGKVGGVILYNEGFILLTGSWALSNNNFQVQKDVAANPAWKYWGAGNGDGLVPVAAYGVHSHHTFARQAFSLTFRGTTRTQVLTMYAHAPRGKVNYSSNPTFIKYGQEKLSFTSSHVFEENPKRLIKNTISSSYTDPEYTASFKRQVYISKVAVYDANKNLIGIASVANPIRKEEDQDLTFKLKLDI